MRARTWREERALVVMFLRGVRNILSRTGSALDSGDLARVIRRIKDGEHVGENRRQR